MAFPKSLRMQLGLSLAQFADLLNTNVGQLSMAESGLRSLPPASLAIVTELQNALTGTKAARQVANAPDEKTVALLNKHIYKCRVQVETMEITVLRLSEKLEATKQLLQLSEAFTPSTPTADMNNVQLQMNILQRKAAKKVTKYTEELLWLQLSIAGLQGEIDKAVLLTTYQHY